ncbi:DUF4426 domain-containing protein [Bowmanella sp. JS7-9]|uniref:DUF4426 domain-containing protein n=1 Tax=Pseudobowmanella zhangzhouensis TaxID=1537679 RepID=A0ABW1XIM0_9ALTE|nr:DUF4426 domain-containing protein [Bowmanella sp. JS7-9]TBX21321.1 hypothetical protein TK45_12215 [Bowmanella sp. JS7-9]
MFKRFLIAIALLASASMAHAEQFKTLGDWDVHYIVFPSTFLQPEVARNYKIQRSQYQAVINISVLAHDSQQALSQVVEGTATDLMGKVQRLTFREVQEGDAIYYLATLNNDINQVWRFAIDIGHGENTQTLKFEQKVWIE